MRAKVTPASSPSPLDQLVARRRHWVEERVGDAPIRRRMIPNWEVLLAAEARAGLRDVPVVRNLAECRL